MFLLLCFRYPVQCLLTFHFGRRRADGFQILGEGYPIRFRNILEGTPDLTDKTTLEFRLRICRRDRFGPCQTVRAEDQDIQAPLYMPSRGWFKQVVIWRFRSDVFGWGAESIQ